MEQNVINSFGYVAKVYEETSFLLKDFNEALAQHGFTTITGNSIGTTYLSRDINSPRYWLTRFAAIFYKPPDQKADTPLLSVTVCFYDLKPAPISPVLVLGVAKGMDHPKQSWNYNWFFSAFFNEGGFLNYYKKENGDLKPFKGILDANKETIYFKNSMSNEKYYWFKEGCLFTVPLLQVKNHNMIQELSERLVKLWEENYGEGGSGPNY